jgi:quinone-modifying oxidoreductase subunit QmoC
VETAREALQQTPEALAQESPLAPAPPKQAKPVRVEPDLDFIRALSKQSGDTFKKCFQCGTCSATCAISPDPDPLPRKEMAWAVWGMKDRLLKDPDVWLCHQCNDCSERCPRGARPGDVLAAVRREAVLHYGFPRFFARWVNEPQWAPFLLGIPAALLTLALLVRDPVQSALGLSPQAGERILYAYTTMFPHWLLNSFFGLLSLLVLLVVVVSVSRFWRAMKSTAAPDLSAAPAKALFPSILSTLRAVFTHSQFALCTQARPRLASHMCVLFGFLALSLVTFWVITAKINPLIRGDFIYPFNFWNPWKMLANLGGAALLVGCFLIILDRLKEQKAGSGTYFDWALIAKIVLVALTGFITEVLHYLRLEPHRQIAYFAHLIFVFVVLMYLPYSKLAHLFYRAAAMVFAEHSGRNVAASSQGLDSAHPRAPIGGDDAKQTATAR